MGIFMSWLISSVFFGLFSFFDWTVVFFFFRFFLVFLCYFFCGGFLSGLFFFDYLSVFLVFLSVFIFFLCVVSMLGVSFSIDSFGSFVFFLSFIFCFLFLCFVFCDLLLFYFSFEFVFILLYVLLLGWGYSMERQRASYYIIFYTLVVSFPFLVFLFCLWGSFFCTKFFLSFSFFGYWWVFSLLVFLVKLPVFGVHLWLPKAHVEAPLAGSMVLAGVLLKLGGYGVIRLFPFVLSPSVGGGGVFFSFGLLGSLFVCFICLRQSDLKSLVAYSSVSHMGVALSGLFSFRHFGLVGGFYMFVSHGFCSSAMFFLLGVSYLRLHTRRLLLSKGILMFFPSLGFWWFLFSALNIGLPPSLGFFSEVYLIIGLMSYDFFNLFFCSLVLLFSCFYSIYFYVVSQQGDSVFSFVVDSVRVREFYIVFSHFFPLVFLVVGG